MGSNATALPESQNLTKPAAEWTPAETNLAKTFAFEWPPSNEQPTTIPPQTGRWCCSTAVRFQSQYVCVVTDGDNSQAETGRDVQSERNSAVGFLAG